ncbi:hypothetical protein MRB53_022725 [Persea americana]|uniref:Uncharacterized protein n=1 Tax=Persea americana TaxID=3435 RepID=A0ACC2L8H1_PERAE|nr:hypothetical protein MRB53_022725 [Persea americana]
MGISKENCDDGGISFDAYEDIPVEVSGSDVPLAVNSFQEIDLGDALNQNIRRCKYACEANTNPTLCNSNISCREGFDSVRANWVDKDSAVLLPNHCWDHEEPVGGGGGGVGLVLQCPRHGGRSA